MSTSPWIGTGAYWPVVMLVFRSVTKLSQMGCTPGPVLKMGWVRVEEKLEGKD